MAKHPLQPIELDERNTPRFKVNKIVQFLLDTSSFDLNNIAIMSFSDEDREQFSQLIGYSLSGFGELSYVSDETYETACRMHDLGETETQARITYLENFVRSIKDMLKQGVSELYGIHPDDLD